MMVSVYETWEKPPSNKVLKWHSMLMRGRRDIVDLGCYRTSGDPMQAVSGHIGKRLVHFEAPPSARNRRRYARMAHTAPPARHPHTQPEKELQLLLHQLNLTLPDRPLPRLEDLKKDYETHDERWMSLADHNRFEESILKPGELLSDG